MHNNEIKQKVTHRNRTVQQENVQEKTQKEGMGRENQLFTHSELYTKLRGNLYL